MSVLQNMFSKSMEQSLREEKKRAEDWKAVTANIHVAHLLCECGKPVKEKLLFNFLTASQLLFENFMYHFFKTAKAESQQKMAAIRASAKVRGEHSAVVLLEQLAVMDPIVTFQDIIEGLQYAHLYRVIGQLEPRNMRILSKHSQCHSHQSCCKSNASLPKPQFLTQAGPPLSVTRTIKANRGTILLTFLEDGRNLAMKVKDELQKPRGKSGRCYFVCTLSDFSKPIIEDHLKNILWILTLVDFVVPILTDSYVQMLEDDSINSTSIDEKYAPFVARLLIADWASNFKNKQLRCFRPKEVTWTTKGKMVYPPILTAVSELSALPLILRKSK